MKQRILWMMDESIAAVRPSNWDKLVKTQEKLVRLIGNKNFNHEVAHPLTCLKNLAKQLHGDRFSSVVDLTGWLTPAIKELFPGVQVENTLSLSRVRQVSSVKLDTTGYVVSLSPFELADIKRSLDLSRTLVVDDVSFSGWTSRKVMELLGLDPETTTHGFLISNVGDLGVRPGAVKMLEGMGSRVVSGMTMSTPDDDGWHLKDLFWHPRLEEAFEIAMEIQNVISGCGAESSEVTKWLTNREVSEILFPESFSSEDILEMENMGNFVLLNSDGLKDGEVHARNPFLWASVYLRDHLDLESIRENKLEVKDTLSELREMTMDAEGAVEASRELGAEVKRTISNRIERR